MLHVCLLGYQFDHFVYFPSVQISVEFAILSNHKQARFPFVFMSASVSASTLTPKVSELPLCDYYTGDGKWTVLTYMALLCHCNGTQALYTVPQ